MMSLLKLTPAAALPENFVYLHDIEPSIITNLMYLGPDNFVGTPVDGYHDNVVILTKPAAQALKCAQSQLNKDGFNMVIYDAYRPQQAVDHFVRWSTDLTSQRTKSWFYPRIDKARSFELGYISAKSSHTRGSTVDISIIEYGKTLSPITPSLRTLKDGFQVMFLADGTVDMGTSVDLMDEASHYENNLIEDNYKEKRLYLRSIMEDCGFAPYSKEWWHFSLKNEPFPDSYFNFPVQR